MSVDDMTEVYSSENESADSEDVEDTALPADQVAEPAQRQGRSTERPTELAKGIDREPTTAINTNSQHRRPKRRHSPDDTTGAVPNPLREHPPSAPEGSPPRSSLLKRLKRDDVDAEVMVYRRANGDIVTRKLTGLAF